MRNKLSLVLLVFSCMCFKSYANNDTLTFHNKNIRQQLSALEMQDSIQNNTLDSLTKCYGQLSGELNQQMKIIGDKISSAKNELEILKDTVFSVTEKNENLTNAVDINANNLQSLSDIVETGLTTASENIDFQKHEIERRSYIIGIAVVIVLLLSVLLSIILHRKGSSEIEELKKKANVLNEKIIEKFSSEISELQKISSSISSQNQQFVSDSAESLIKALADRITFIEMTLYRMDHSVRGYKHLLKALAQMKDNLMANGYEIVDMLGKPYHEGMKVIANFNEDETLEKGQQIITGITKPQINYQGKMIQAAQITVSQNI